MTGRRCERWIEGCPRDLLDHVIAANEAHLKRLFSEYIRYYPEDRTYFGLEKQTPARVVIRLMVVELSHVRGFAACITATTEWSREHEVDPRGSGDLFAKAGTPERTEPSSFTQNGSNESKCEDNATGSRCFSEGWNPGDAQGDSLSHFVTNSNQDSSLFLETGVIDRALW